MTLQDTLAFRIYLWPILLTVTVSAVSSTANLATPDLSFAHGSDKIIHFFIFGLIATSIIRIPYFIKQGTLGWVYTAVIVACFGGLDEWWQSLTPGRTAELADLLANVAGASVAASAYFYWNQYRKTLEYSIGKNAEINSSEAA
ncbi:MAG: Uncharacterised protein [Opitutia bacterium UBA7350]|nr:MAG: Uncharacterised protein [Opitutae bacterium UBA7350]